MTESTKQAVKWLAIFWTTILSILSVFYFVTFWILPVVAVIIISWFLFIKFSKLHDVLEETGAAPKQNHEALRAYHLSSLPGSTAAQVADTMKISVPAAIALIRAGKETHERRNNGKWS